MTGLHKKGLLGSAGAALLWLVERSALMRARRIQVLSDFSADLLWKLYRIGPDRIVKIPGGADLTQFQPLSDRSARRAALGLPTGRPLFFTLRNLEPRMGLDTLIAAMDRLRRRAPEVLLLIGGAGSLRPELERLVQARQLTGHVRFLGFVPEAELPRYYGVADAFVLPTRDLEGFGLVTVEALACGTPVLGTPVGATPELLVPLDASLIFSDATADAMTLHLARFLDTLDGDSAAARRLREACRRHAEAHYDWQRSVDGLERVLWELIGAPAAAETALGAAGPREALRS
jgi:glycosyltransferase involved in cell wall biosynthesis